MNTEDENSQDIILSDLLLKTCSQSISTPLRLQQAQQLRVFLSNVKNDQLIKKKVERIVPSLEKILLDTELQEQGVILFATLAVALKQDAAVLLQTFLQRLNQDVYANILIQYVDQIKTQKISNMYTTQLQLILTGIQNILEHGATSNVRMIDIIEKLAVDFPTVFKNQFQDLIDVLVGWYLDRETSFRVRQRITTCFCNFKGLWITNIDFTCGLLDKFIIDMKSINDERQYNNFVSCFAAIALALDTLFSVCATKLLPRLFQTFIASVDRFSDKQKRIWKATSEAIVTFSTILKAEYIPYISATIDYLSAVLRKFEIPNDWLEVTVQIVDQIPDLTLDVVRPLLQATLNYAHTKTTFQPFAKLYAKFFKIEGLIQELFSVVPRLENQQAWNRSKLSEVNFSMAMIMACMDEKIMEWTWKAHNHWGIVGYYVPSVFVSFLKSLHEHYTQLLLTASEAMTTLQPLILQCCQSALENSSMSSSIKIQVMTWISTLITGEYVKAHVGNTVIPILVAMSRDRDFNVRAKALTCSTSVLLEFKGNFDRSDSVLFELLDLVMSGSDDMEDSVSSVAMSCLSDLAPILMDGDIWDEFKLFKSGFKAPTIPSAFKSRHFALLFKHFQSNETIEVSTIERLYHVCTSDQSGSVADNSKKYLSSFYYQWVVTEAARYCVAHRLRTHLGTAFQTFESFEKLLQERNDNYLFLQFIDELEREMTRAIDGPSHHSPTTVQFFETNKKVCQDWFSRFRPLIARVSENATHVRSSSQRLQDLRVMILKTANESTDWSLLEKHVVEYDRVIVQMGSRLIEMRDVDAIQGLLKWTESVFSFVATKIDASKPKLDAILNVLTALRQESNGEWESAIDLYKIAFEEVSHLDAEITAPLIADRVVICFTNLQDVTGIENWQKFMDSFRQKFSNDEKLSVLSHSQHTDVILRISKEMQKFDQSQPVDLPEAFNSIDRSKVAYLQALTKPNEKKELMEASRLLLKSDLERLRFCTSKQVHPYLSQLYLTKHTDSAPAKNAQDSNRISFLQELRRVNPPNNNLILEQVKSARSTNNLQLASRLLEATTAKDSTVALERIRIKSKLDSHASLVDLISYLKSAEIHKDKARSKMFLIAHEQLKNDETFDSVKQDLQMSREEALEKFAVNAVDTATDASSRRKALVNYAEWTFTQYETELAKISQIVLTNEEKEQLTTCGKVELIEATFNNILLPQIRQILDSKESLQIDSSAATIKSKFSEYENIDTIYTVFLEVKRRLYAPILKSMQSYFESLRLQDDVFVTLQLLKLITRHANEFESEILHGIETTSVRGYYEIVPQLFAHIGGDPIVQQIIKSLLLKIGTENTQMIAYPLIVGCYKKNVSKHYLMVKSELSQVGQAQRILDGVQILVKELSRITLLWEEVWLDQLPSIHRKLVRDYGAFKNARETIRSTESEKSHLERGKYAQLMRSAIVQLQSTVKLTIGGLPETKHEVRFQEKFETILTRIVSSINQMPNEDSAMELAAQTLHQIGKTMMSIYHGTNQLSLQSISPVLASIDAHIPMPMMSTSDRVGDRRIEITKIENNVQILGSKTKPKKLAMIGTDGNKYAYLLKGREDLHLDERVMQFLRVVNKALACDSSSKSRRLRARHYDVIPLSDRSGLIRWVDGSTPILSLHREWFMKTKGSVPYRPVDSFFSKLVPALKQHGISSATYPYPKDILRTVLKQLMAETPKDLLAKKLWLNSPSLDAWWDTTRRYNRSVAVMSMVGYTIGLGDRHLDNILVCDSGEVVHIDYNVCFDKGLRLKVPEVVPFRMTPIIQTALGVTGVEGTFRTSCEQTMRVLRDHKNTLLMLLEAFVYDPLVDWTSEKQNEDMYNLELKVSLGLFTSRITEMKDFMNNVFTTSTERISNLQRTWSSIKEFVDTSGKNVDEYWTATREEENSRNELKLMLEEKQKLQPQLEKSTQALANQVRTTAPAKRSLQGRLEKQLRSYGAISDLHHKAYEVLMNWRDFNAGVFTLAQPTPQLSHLLPYLPDLVKRLGTNILVEFNELDVAITQVATQRQQIITELFVHVKELQTLLVKCYGSWQEYMTIDASYHWSNKIYQILLDADNMEQVDEIAASLEEEDEKQQIQQEKDELQEIVESVEAVNQKMESSKARLEEKGISYMQKALAEAKRNLIEFVSTKLRNTNELHSYLVKYTLFTLLDQLDEQEDGLDDSIGGLEEDEQIERKIPKGFGKLSRLTSMLDVLVQLEADLRVPIMREQIALLTTSLKHCITAVSEFYEMFSRSLFAQTLTQPVAYTVDQIQERLMTDNLLKAYDALFSKMQVPFKQFTTVNDTDHILHVEQLSCIEEILQEVSSSDRSIYSQEELHATLVSILQNYVENILAKVTFPTFTSLLKSWGIHSGTRNSLNEIELPWNSATRETEMLNIVLSNFLTSQQVCDEEKLQTEFVKMEHGFLKYMAGVLQNDLAKFMWSSVNREQIATPSVMYVVQWRNQLLQSIATKATKLKQLTDNVQVPLEKYRKIEVTIAAQLGNVNVSAQQSQKLMENIKVRDDNLLRISAHDQQLSQLCLYIVELEAYRSKNETTEKLKQELRPLVRQWAEMNHAEVSLKRLQSEASERLSQIETDEETLTVKLRKLTPYVKKNHSSVHNIEERYKQMVNGMIDQVKQTEEQFVKYVQVVSEVENMVESIVRVTTGFKNWNSTLKNFRGFLQTHDKFCRSVFADLIKKRLEVMSSSVSDFTPKTEKTIQEIQERIVSANQQISTQLETIRQQINKHNATSTFDDDDEELVEEEQEKQKEVGNSYAIGVLKRVQTRLDCEVDVENQVADVILQSTSLDNLSSMFEGWLAFV